MAAVQPPVCDFDWPAPDFALPATDGKTYTLADVRGETGTLILFICNHCPYVIAVMERLTRDATELMDMGVGVAAICANDAAAYPADSFEKMIAFAAAHALPFPYLHDESQATARAYGAVCTPEFFGFNADLGLQYRGRLDAARLQPPADGTRRDLYEAMAQTARVGRGPAEQIPSIGCSIKWKAA